ncbi:MAG TPA: AsmA family protein [Candidatus Omnitrophota bacterium]|nr:AsmA family protein [Candidatus Omnitrophota bacterium]
MKIVKIIFLTLLVVCLVLFLGVFIFLKTVDLNRFKGQITQQASKALGRDVQMKHVTFNFSVMNGMTLHLSGLSIADDSAFSSDSMLYIDSSHLGVDFLAFLLKRQILVSNIELDSPRINLVRNSDGRINVQELGVKTGAPELADSKGASSKDADPSIKRGEGPEKGFGFGEMLIRMVRISDGTVVFTDRMTVPPQTISAGRIKLEISNVSLNAPFPFSAEASVWSNHRNIRVSGLARIDMDNQQARIDDMKIETDLADILLDRLYKEIPASQEAGLQEKMEGEFVMNVHQMILGQNGLLVLSSDGQLKDGKIQIKDSPIPIKDVNARLTVTESDAEIEDLTMPLASGQVKISGRMMEYLTKQKFLIDLDISAVQLDELGEQIKLPAKLEGQVQVKSKMNGQGITPEAVKASLTADGAISVKDGKVVDINILSLVLSKISFIPNLAEKIEASLPEKYKEKLKAKDTILEKVEVKAKIDKGMMFINNAEVNADGFLVIANGKVDFDQNLDLNADFFIPSDLSAGLTGVSNELTYFFDNEKRIHIPFKPYSGKLAALRMYPDIEDIGKEILRGKGEEELKKVIFKALDINQEQPTAEQYPAQEGQPQTGQTDSGQTETPAQEPVQARPEEQLINDIIDMIPIFK